MDSTKFIFEESIPVSDGNDGETPAVEGENGEKELLTPPEGENEFSCNAENDPEVSSEGKKTKRILVFFNAAVGLIFCTLTVLFSLSGVISAVDKYIFEDGKSMMLSEVTAGSVRFSENKADDNTDDDNPVNKSDNPPQSDTEAYPISEYDLSAGKSGLFTLNNQTSFSPDTDSLLKGGNKNPAPSELYAKYGDTAPVILIVHTHGTEAYSNGGDTYTKNDAFRSENTEENVVAVGTVMEQVFNAAGINTIHCTEMFDRESYKDSYSRSYESISEYLSEYPSISYVFDVHRDSIIKDDLTKIRPTGSYGEKSIAQAMLVVGTNEGGANHKEWEKNLSFALNVQNNLYSLSATLPRKINLRSAAFNQGLSNGSLLLEIGSCGNTLEEAKRCGALTAIAISDSILRTDCNLLPDDFLK